MVRGIRALRGIAGHRLQTNAAETPRPSRGMTMIELSITLAIVSLLTATLVGLSRHTNAVIALRKAQVELGEWGEALHQWYLAFGEYPYARIDEHNNESRREQETGRLAVNNLSNIVHDVYVTLQDNGRATNVTFRSFMKRNISIKDPWGKPYIYFVDEGHLSYQLFSCGPDGKSEVLGDLPETSLDDLTFER